MGFDQRLNAPAPTMDRDRPASRIDQDVELVKTMTGRVEQTTDRITRHAHSLGYFQPTPATGATAPTPVITTLADALQALAHAVDSCSGSLNVFD